MKMSSELILCFTICVHSATRHNIHFHKNGLALRLALKQRHKGTRKWPITLLWFCDTQFKPTLFSFAQTMRTELLTKQNDFLPVAQHGALLFSVMCELQKLHPYYRFPLDGFMQLFHDTVAERNRGKKSSGSPAARAAELVTALSRKIFERTSWSLFQSK